MLWVYYGFIKKNATLLISINSIGILMETIYILIFLVFASNQAKRHALLKEYFLCMGGFSLIFVVSWYLFSDVVRVNIVGWINMAISVAALASPLNIVLHVLQTKSVEFLPIYFSFFFTLSEIMWCSYGLLLKDFYIVMPNIFGFFLGFIQIWLYVIYWRPNSVAPENENVADHVMDVEMLRMPEHDVDSRRSLSNGETETNSEAN
nr:bidirectional sugar transporter N3-like [Ipomoea batatas]